MPRARDLDRKSTRLNSSHVAISYAVFCSKKKKPWSTLCSHRVSRSLSASALPLRFVRLLQLPFFFFNEPATPEIYTLSLHDALPIGRGRRHPPARRHLPRRDGTGLRGQANGRWEVHTSELQSRGHLVCRLLREK